MAKKVDKFDPEDGLIVSEVGAWATEKHERLRKYVDASRGARAKFLPPRGTGGATYIDLFSGPGRSVIEKTSNFIDGSPLIAYKAARQSDTRFSELYLNDIDPDNTAALDRRVKALGGAARIYTKPAERAVDDIVASVNPSGLHFAFLDPYNIETLPFSIIRKLTSLTHIDLLIHVSVFDLQRNLRRYVAPEAPQLDAFMPGWRDAVDVDVNRPDQAVRHSLLQYWLGEIRRLGTSPAEGIELVSGPGGQRLYWLVFVSAHELARRLWDDIRNVHVQTRMDL
ncbi:three-Cys-motif partner protein TcmP [Bradyrhizobium sp. OAE829]|uniref:three-Cys-motif partner protein TcmP n=1 Tax=Bradyrhizobium sp. OAE829 TaxID=2663807 RepID=UPI00178BCB33